MKATFVISAFCLLPLAAHAGEVIPIETAPATNRWTFGMSFAPLLNVDASFSGLGTFASPFSPAPLGAGQERFYDDGYVRVDASGNAGGVTSFWGYTNPSQYDPSGTGTLSMNITNSASNGRAGATEDFSPGMEFFGYFDLGKIADFAGRPVTWGLKGGFHYANISIEDGGALTSDLVRLTDRYDLGGNLAPGAPFAGTPGGGFYMLLPESPAGRDTTVIPGGALVQGQRDLDVDMVTLSVGPYVQVPVAERISLFAEAGVSVSIAHGEYQFDSLTNVAGFAPQVSAGKDTRTVLLPGIYAGVSAMWKLSDTFGLYGSARYQYLDSFSIETGGSEATLSFDGSAVIALGAVWSF